MRVRSGRREGTLVLDRGRVVEAECPGLTGEAAVVEMTTWPTPSLELLPAPPVVDPPLKASLDDLLEAALHRIERQGVKTATRVHPGTDVSAVDITLDLGKLDAVLADLRRDLGEGLLSCEVVYGPRGVSLASYRASDHDAPFYADLADYLESSLRAHGAAPLGRWCLMELEGMQAIALLLVGPYRWGMLLDRNHVQLGYLLNLILPECGQRFAEALGGLTEAEG